MKWSLSTREVVNLLGEVTTSGTFDGNLTGMRDLREAKPGDLSFLSGGKYSKFLETTEASVVLVPEGQAGEPAPNQMWIQVENPSLALARICEQIERLLAPDPYPGIHPTAIVDPTARIADSVSIGPYCIIGKNVIIGKKAILDSSVRVEDNARIGEGTHLFHNATIGWGCRIGRNCLLYPSAVVGSDGFGFYSDKDGHRRLPQVGIVVIEDNVEVGSNSSIDRARFSETRIGEGTKIDNLVQVGHNVTIGKHCILCASVGIAGSVEMGNFVVLAGQVGISGHVTIGDGVTASGKAGITKDIAPGQVISGVPAKPHREDLKQQAYINKLGDLIKRVKQLEKSVGLD